MPSDSTRLAGCVVETLEFEDEVGIGWRLSAQRPAKTITISDDDHVLNWLEMLARLLLLCDCALVQASEQRPPPA